MLKVKETSPTLLDFIVEVLNSEDRVAEARMVERFLNSYDYRYKTEYLAFLVADGKKWKDRSYLNLGSNPATPLEIATILVGDRDAFHKSLTLTERKEPKAQTATATTINDLEDAQKLLRNLTFKNHHSKLASAALATDLQVEGREKIQYGLEPKRLAQLESAARLLSLIGIRLSSNEHDQKETLLLYAARIFERLAVWELEHKEFEAAIDAMIDAAIIYGVAGYDANARVLMDTMYEIQGGDLTKLTPSYQFTVLFLSGRLPELEDKVAELVLETKQFAPDKSLTEDKWADSVGQSLAQVADLLVARSFGLLLHYLRVGRNELINSAIDGLQHSATVYSMVGEYKSSHLSTILMAYSARLLQDSPHVLLPVYITEQQMDSGWKTYLRRLRLSKFPMMFLWNSQQEALKAELLGEKSLFISMPTSAGKTRTVELAIFSALKDHPEGRCVYVVPTRALAAEVEESLASRLGPMKLGVSVLYGGYDFSPFEEDILAENRIFVLTPEKLDLLTRHDDDFKKKISLIIMDEVQEIGSPTPSPRTLRMELILSRMLYIAEKNKARVICLSAMVSNREDFAKWISGSPENVAHTEWQPTFKRYGLFQWEQDRGRIWYPPLNDEFPTENFYVPLLFAKQDLSDEDKGRFEVAARVSTFYSKTGPTLVFTTSKTFVDKIVDKITEIFQSNPPDMIDKREQIARRCADILGEDHKLVKSIRLGFCYHHADVPRSIRRLLERAIKDGTLPLIVSTTTLAQGVNLPIKNVIVHTLSFGGYISTTQFWNAAGRAGRAGYETEGHVVFCYRPDLERIVTAELEKSESFVASGIRKLIESRLPSVETENEFIAQWALASTSQFRKDWESYDSWRPRKRHNAEVDKDEILAILDPQLLAWALEESVDEIDDTVVEKWIGKTCK